MVVPKFVEMGHMFLMKSGLFEWEHDEHEWDVCCSWLLLTNLAIAGCYGAACHGDPPLKCNGISWHLWLARHQENTDLKHEESVTGD